MTRSKRWGVDPPGAWIGGLVFLGHDPLSGWGAEHAGPLLLRETASLTADIEHMAVDPETAQDVATQSNRLLEVRMIVRACRATRSG